MSAVKIFMPAGADAPVYAPYVDEYPPDTNAALRWPQNRQPEKWRDRREVDVSGTIAHQIARMTPAEREADALALAARVNRRLAELTATTIEPVEDDEEPE